MSERRRTTPSGQSRQSGRAGRSEPPARRKQAAGSGTTRRSAKSADAKRTDTKRAAAKNPAAKNPAAKNPAAKNPAAKNPAARSSGRQPTSKAATGRGARTTKSATPRGTTRTRQSPKTGPRRKPARRPAPKTASKTAPKASRPKKRRPPRRLRLGSTTRRLRVGFVLVAIVASIFAGRLLQVQGFEAAAYADYAAGERLRTVTLPASRGNIIDASGVPLATTVEAFDVTADPVLTTEDAARMAAILAPILDEPEATLADKLSQPDTRFVYLARQVAPTVWDEASGALEDAGLSGVFRESNPLRIYPSNDVAANIVGFVGADGKGLAGLEYALDSDLRGHDGTATYEIGASGQRIPLAQSAQREPKPGADVQLTIDRDVQWAAQQAITEQVEKTGAESGEVTVLDIDTGEIVALATAPTFDANEPTAAPDADRGNSSLQDIYEPGSVFKPLTAAAAIDSGYVSPDAKITVPGSLDRDGKTISDYWWHDTINLTLAGAVAKSSNIGTVLAAERMPAEDFRDYLRRFGIGQPTGIGFPGESKGILPKDSWSDLTRATIAFGQGVSVNAVQLAAAIATLANGGVRVDPTLVRGYLDEDGRLTPEHRPGSERVVSEAAAKAVTAMMEQVTAEDGVAPTAAIPGYRVAGKTGTAQRVDSDCGCYSGYTTSFVGFAPADDPEYLVYASVHDPQGESSGSATAAPVFKEVMEFTLQKYGIPPTGSRAPDLELEW